MNNKTKNVLAVLLVIGCGACGSVHRWRSATLLYFDTVCELRVYCLPERFPQIKADVQAVFARIEDLFSPSRAVLDHPDVLFLFQKSIDIHRLSGGAFDITVGPLSDLWGFYTKEHHVPEKNEIIRALKTIGMNRISFLKEGLALPSGMRLDWGGIAKGFGIDRAVEKMRETGVPRGFINAGGDLFCWGMNPENQEWRVGIQHPRRAGYLAVLPLSDEGAATTGDYQRYFIRNGVRYHHVFNPATGYPAEGKQSVTVYGPETLVCDALSTALFVSAEPEQILAHFKDYGAVIVDGSGRIQTIGRPISLQYTDKR
ncbi:MAG: FAD:protein FMN transferase [Acidobacteria bacterium]|nr:FAD:protein FMN transferase [Acidobacteriota bacterium]MBU4494005.1 FAD:protein FMN transferase [Acidobacteriota bacterium]MCG2814667.1 FAD:protein FMN transferase [Candidatus Aminicenantes bacterium]